MEAARQEITLYDKLGGEASIKAVVERFYENLMRDPVLRPYFERADMNRLKRHQALFISQALGGPKQYSGRDVRTAHRGMGITSDHFDRTAGHLAFTIRSFGVDWSLIDPVLEAVAGLKPEIVERD